MSRFHSYSKVAIQGLEDMSYMLWELNIKLIQRSAHLNAQFDEEAGIRQQSFAETPVIPKSLK